MMRAPRSFAVVLRRLDGTLHVRERAMSDGARGLSRLPFVRGLATLVESLRLGSEALRFSAEQLEADHSRPVGRVAPRLGVLSAFGFSLFLLATGDGEPAPTAERKRGGGGGLMLVVAIAFLVALPQGIAAGLNRAFNLRLEVQSAGFQAMTGAIKLLVVVGYLLAIRRVPEIRRVFQYHGAEHKTISTYEAGEALTVAHARAKTTLHPRCGTTFLVMVVLVSIVLFTVVGALLPRIHTGRALLDNVVFFAEKLPFLPLLVAVTFELQRLFARFAGFEPLQLLLWPGFLVQRITTDEPDDSQLEVALASLRATLFRQSEPIALVAASTVDHDPGFADAHFPSYEALLRAERLRPTDAAA